MKNEIILINEIFQIENRKNHVYNIFYRDIFQHYQAQASLLSLRRNFPSESASIAFDH